MKQRIRLLAAVVCLAAWQVACGGGVGGDITPAPPTITSVTVSPALTTVLTGKTATFTATVAGTGNYSSSVTWSASAGTINSSGDFTAPNAAGAVTVKATSTQDPTKSGSATVTVNLPPPPTATLTASPTTIVLGQSSTLTWACTNSTTASGTWTTGTLGTSGSATVTPTTTGTVTYTVTCTGAGGTANAPATVLVVLPLSITVSATPTTVNAGDTNGIALSVTVMNGAGNAKATWTMNPSIGTITSTGDVTADYIPPATVSATTTVTITATVTDASGSATGTVAVTVKRSITLGIQLPNNEFYSDLGDLLNATMTCTGCELGDTLNGQFFSLAGSPVSSQVMENPSALTSWVETVNFFGPNYVPGLIKGWISSPDGTVSNAVWLTFNGSENVAAQDPSSGEIFYYSAGNGSDASGAIVKFKSDGTPDGSFTDGTASGAGAIALDGQTIYKTQPTPLTSGANGVVAFEAITGGSSGGGFSPTNGEPLAISAAGGLVCVTIPTGDNSPNIIYGVDAVDCNSSSGTFTIPLPSGSQPAAIKVIDSSHIVLYGRGDQTLRWYTISGTTATAAGTLQLSDLTAADGSYWQQYPNTGGWDLVMVGSTLGVMGQVVNADGTVSQKLALVDSTNQTLIQYVDLPAGTVHIAADPTNNAIVAEYPDFTVSPPVTRFERIYADTGNSILLQSTSTIVPGAGFLVTLDGSRIAVFVGGQADFELNQ